MPTTQLPRALAAVRGGVVTRGDLRAAGADDDLGDRLVREGTWRRLAPSVYLAHSGEPTPAQVLLAARHHVGPHAVVTGLAACRALGAAYVPDDPVVEVLIPPGTRVVSTPWVRVRQSGRALQTWRRGPLAYAAPARAVADAARGLDDLRAVRALVLGAVCDGLTSAADLADELASGPRRGSALLRTAVADATAGAWSAPEAEAAALVAAAVRRRRLPPYVLNPTLLLDGRALGRPDGWIPGCGVGWQVESRAFHTGDDAFDATLAVHDRYAAAGLVLLHVTPRRLRECGPVWVDQLVAAVAARPAPAEPPGLTVRPCA